MGRKQRNRQRKHDMRKQPNAPKGPFVERKVRELQDMDLQIQAILDKGKQ